MLSQRVRSLGVALAAIGGIWLLASTTGHSPLDASGETWTPGPDMLVRQYDATSVMLQDGRVLVIGGKNDAGFLDASETYDSVTGQWRLTSTMRAPRARATATVLSDGRVLVAGGVTGDSGPALASAEIFDPVNDQWMTVAPMRVPRTGHTATRLQDGRVLVVAGFTGANSTSSHYVSAEIYEPALDMWVAVQNIRTRREGHSATLLNDGRVLIAGGGNYSAYLRSAEIFNPATGVWTEVAPMGDLRYEHVAAALPDGSPLVMGGVGWPNYLATVEAYDPQANQWRRLASMNSRRWRARGATLGDGRVIVVGGLSDASGSPTAVRNAEVYDPTLGTWTLTPSLATARVKSILAVLPRDEVLVASGHDGQYLLSTEILRRPVTDVTPPVITSSVSGTLGANGWYISDVRVTWTVVDPESPVTSTSGCGNFILGTDSRGLTLVCEATSGGGINSGSVAIRRDVSAPAIDIVSPTGSPTVVLGQTLTANYSCLDLVAGVAGCAGPVPSSASADTTTLGLHNFAVTATDAAGNTSTASTAYTVIKDATTPYLYVTNHDQAQIQIVDPVTARVIGTIPGVTARPYGIAITPDRRKAYVANAQGTDVIVVDLVSDQVRTRVRVGDYQPSNPQRVAISPDGRQAWVTCFWDNSVVVIDTATDTVMNRFATGSGATGVAIDPAGTAVYVTNAVGDSLSTIDVATGTVTTVAVGDAPQEVVVSPDGQQVYVALQFEGAIGVVDTAQQTVTRIAVGSNVVSLALAPDGRRLYAARDEPGGTLLAIDTATRQIVWAIPFGIYPVGIAVSDDGRYVAANGNGTGVTVLIDPVTQAQRTVSVPTSAIGLAFLPTPRAATTITLDPVTMEYGGGPVILRATLRAGETPVGGRLILFAVGEDAMGIGVTRADGVAELTATVAKPAGEYPGTVHASYPGGAGLLGATASTDLTVTKANPAIAWAPPASISYGTPLSMTQLDASSELPGSFVYAPAIGTVLPAGEHVLTVTFTPNDQANYLSATSTTTIELTKAVPVVSWSTPAEVISGTILGAAQLNATANVPGTFAYDPSNGIALQTGDLALTATFTPTDSANYTMAFASVGQKVAAPLVATVTAPNGGEKISTTSAYVIAWSASGGVGGGPATFDVAVSIDSGVTYSPIAECTALSGTARSCTWNAPSPATSKARVRVTARDAVGNSQVDASDADFTVGTLTPSVTVTSPAAGAVWSFGSVHTIVWTHNLGPNSFVDIALEANGRVQPVAMSVKNAGNGWGSHSWTVPNEASTLARILVSWTSGSAIGVSGTFAITGPAIAVTAPSGGFPAVTWNIGKVKQVKWTHSLPSGKSVVLEVSRVGGPWTCLTFRDGSCSSVVTTTGTDGSFYWTVSGPPTSPNGAVIRVRSIEYGVEGRSAAFTIK